MGYHVPPPPPPPQSWGFVGLWLQEPFLKGGGVKNGLERSSPLHSCPPPSDSPQPNPTLATITIEPQENEQPLAKL